MTVKDADIHLKTATDMKHWDKIFHVCFTLIQDMKLVLKLLGVALIRGPLVRRVLLSMNCDRFRRL